jgi:hypothetical protein
MTSIQESRSATPVNIAACEIVLSQRRLSKLLITKPVPSISTTARLANCSKTVIRHSSAPLGGNATTNISIANPANAAQPMMEKTFCVPKPIEPALLTLVPGRETIGIYQVELRILINEQASYPDKVQNTANDIHNIFGS